MSKTWTVTAIIAAWFKAHAHSHRWVSSTRTIAAIVADWLEAHGYDGLCEGPCGCALADLMPCGAPYMDCAAGYQHANVPGNKDRDDVWIAPFRPTELPEECAFECCPYFAENLKRHCAALSGEAESIDCPYLR